MLKEKLGLSAAEMPTIGGAVFAYLFHRIDQRELVAIIDDKERAEKIVEVLRTSGEILKNCKLYAWAYFKSRHGCPKPSPKDFEVDRSDVRLLSRLNLKHLAMRFESWSLADYDSLIEDTLECAAMQAHIGKLISKKMIFLIKSYGVPRGDIERDLKQAALRAIYMHYPRFESHLHMTNVAKSAIHNTAMSMITYHTAPSRQRLAVNAEGVFEAKHVAVDNVAGIEAPSGYLEHAKEQLEVLAKLGNRNMRPDVQRFLLCCAGHYDEGFSEFLEQDNSEAVDDMAYSRYLAKARRYFNFSANQVDKLFQKLRLHLE